MRQQKYLEGKVTLRRELVWARQTSHILQQETSFWHFLQGSIIPSIRLLRIRARRASDGRQETTWTGHRSEDVGGSLVWNMSKGPSWSQTHKPLQPKVANVDAFAEECCGINKASNHGERRQQQLEAVILFPGRCRAECYCSPTGGENSGKQTLLSRASPWAAGEARKRSDDLGWSNLGFCAFASVRSSLSLSTAEEAALIWSAVRKARLHPSSPQNMCCKLHLCCLPLKRWNVNSADKCSALCRLAPRTRK